MQGKREVRFFVKIYTEILAVIKGTSFSYCHMYLSCLTHGRLIRTISPIVSLHGSCFITGAGLGPHLVLAQSEWCPRLGLPSPLVSEGFLALEPGTPAESGGIGKWTALE